MIIGLIGMSRHGKDTVGSILVKNGFKRYAFADKAKDSYCNERNITREYLEENKNSLREDLIEYIESFKETDKFYWIKKIQEDIERDLQNGEKIVITDVRRIEEVFTLEKMRDALSDVMPVYLFQVIRPFKNGGEFDYDQNTLGGVEYAHFHNLIDGIIVNNSTVEKLQEATQKIYDKIKN